MTDETTIQTSVKFSKWIGDLKKKMRRGSKTQICDDIMRVMKSQPVLLEELR